MIYLQEYEKEIKLIEIALFSLHYRGIGIKSSIECIVSYLKEQFELSGDLRYLETALLNIQAYLNLGFVYEEKAECFNQVLKLYNCQREDVFLKSQYDKKCVRLNRNQIKKMIGRWRPSKENPMKIAEVVDDILDKVENKKLGHYYYHYISSYEKSRKKQNADMYELVVLEDECFFVDVKNQKYYTFY